MGAETLLIVDDEPSIVGRLDELFRRRGYETVAARDGASALKAVAATEHAGRRIDLALLDVNMPGMDGFALCRSLRERLSCPIIFLTARVEDADQLDGFAAGGDDYVLKPFSLEVLAGRVRAHLEREERSRSHNEGAQRRFAGLTIDYAERSVVATTASGKTTLDLTRTEFDIVALLSRSPGRVYDREAIYERVWGWNAVGDPSIVREHIRRIRKKCVDAGIEREFIETVWGVGYRWAAR